MSEGADLGGLTPACRSACLGLAFGMGPQLRHSGSPRHHFLVSPRLWPLPWPTPDHSMPSLAKLEPANQERADPVPFSLLFDTCVGLP